MNNIETNEDLAEAEDLAPPHPAEPEPTEFTVHARDGAELSRFPCILDANDWMHLTPEAHSVRRSRDGELLATKVRLAALNSRRTQ